jgi:SAM-dependent methyltransferase
MDDRDKRPDFYSCFTTRDAAQYHDWYLAPPGSDIVLEQKQAICEILGQGGTRKLLDIGCGTGLFTEWFHTQGFIVTGMDSSEAMIALAKTHCAACAALHVADAARMPFADASFDIATFITSLEFVADAQCALKEAARVARGQVVILLLNPGHPMNAERKRKSAASGGVFKNARLWTPGEMETLIRKSATGECNITTHGYSGNSPYFILEMSY